MERERWVVGEFLKLRGIKFSVEELHSPPQQSKVDVEFRDARFQIKKLTTPGSRRGAEVRAIYRRVMAAKSLEETTSPLLASDIPPVEDTLQLVHDAARELAADTRYIEAKNSLDLLFYITRTRASRLQRDANSSIELAPLGWRSISCLMGNQAVVIFARDGAPAFLRHDGSVAITR